MAGKVAVGLAWVDGKASVALALFVAMLWTLTAPQGVPMQAAATVMVASDIRNTDGGVFIFSASLFPIRLNLLILIDNGTVRGGVQRRYRVFPTSED